MCENSLKSKLNLPGWESSLLAQQDEMVLENSRRKSEKPPKGQTGNSLTNKINNRVLDDNSKHKVILVSPY